MQSQDTQESLYRQGAGGNEDATAPLTRALSLSYSRRAHLTMKDMKIMKQGGTEHRSRPSPPGSRPVGQRKRGGVRHAHPHRFFVRFMLFMVNNPG